MMYLLRDRIQRLSIILYRLLNNLLYLRDHSLTQECICTDQLPNMVLLGKAVLV
jgi:hypothetical protein